MAPPDRWSRLDGLFFTARTLVDGLYAGGHASPRHGPGLEFHDYRAYAPGDALAAVDWKLFGRTDRLYLRRYQRYTDLHAHLVLDASASMGFAGFDRRGRPLADTPTRPTKLRYAQELAAALAFVLIKQADRAGLAVFDRRLRQVLPAGGTWPHLQRLCAALETVQPAALSAGAVQGDVGASLAQLHALLRQRGRGGRGMVVLISDLLDDPAGLFDGLSRLRHDRFEVVVLQVLTPEELDLAPAGDLRLRMADSETPRQVAAHLPTVAQRYRQLMDAHRAALRRGCAGRGVDYHLLRTDQPVLEGLRAYLRRRAARGSFL